MGVRRPGEFMEDEHSEPKKPLRGWLGLLAGVFLGLCIHNWHMFRDHGLIAGLRSLRWDFLFGMTVGAVASLWLGGQRKEEQITTVAVGGGTSKKLQ